MAQTDTHTADRLFYIWQREAGARNRDLKTGLLQRSTDRSATGNYRTFTTGTEVSVSFVFELSTREQVMPCLLQLHWLLVRWCVQFKL